jgi:ABC-type lipoprotein release transport system permease subunit
VSVVSAPARAAVGLWSRTELVRRWRALLLLGVLAGVAGGLVIATLEGADRTSTSYQRMREELRGADVVFFPSQSNVFDADLTLLDEIPEVESWGGFALLPSQFLELPPGSSPFVLVGPDWFGDIEQAKVIEGRLPDPDADDELVLNEAAAAPEDELGFDEVIGTELTLATITLEEFLANGEQEPEDWTTAQGPKFTMRIVGVVRQPMVGAVSFASDPFAATGPGFAAAHFGELTPYFQNAVVRLRNGADDVPAFREGIRRVYGQDLIIKDLADDIKRVENSTGLERTGLLLFAAAVLIASIVLVGQAFLRSAHAGADAVPTLRSMGMGPRSLVRGIALPHLLTVAVTIVVAGTTAALLSTRFPIGLARRLDPDTGMRLRPAYVLGGALLVGFAALVATAVSAVLAIRASLRHASGGRVRMVGAASRAGAPVPAAVGASLALEQPARAGSAQVRPALLAAVGAVLGVIGAITLVGGIDDALANPARSGVNWDVGIDGADEELAESMQDDRRVADLALARRAPSQVGGKDAPVYTIESLKGRMDFSVLEGRAPEGPDETLLGPRTAKVLGLGIGDEVTVGPTDELSRVVGIGLLMQTAHGAFDEGARISPAAFYDRYGIDATTSEPILLADVPRVDDRQPLIDELLATGRFAYQPGPVPDVSNLANVRRLPYLLAGFLVVLGLGAAAHALLTVSRRRRRELAVMRAIGLTPGQTGACVAWQALVVGGIAVIVGIPLGLVVGRQAWRAVADAVPLIYVGPLDPGLLLLAVPVALVGLLLLALPPARRAARLHTAEVLRAE